MAERSDRDADAQRGVMGSFSLWPDCEILANRSRITVTPCAGMKLWAGCSLRAVSHVWLVKSATLCCQTVFNMTPQPDSAVSSIVARREEDMKGLIQTDRHADRQAGRNGENEVFLIL